ncbi:DUF805 domain-containing protein [Mucilaginibacter sp. KACC 22063]|uniref:DUF805 domain-containing protein n=1 Tax=Mucilaginibacter sp. KACC 22063 TaxID=3025666 RepID=UPI002365DD4A|nr:DUF805 domain-containing protein [Mucilaginibacter sp. KACC 22063]WDF56360.1 DUF805 domain-containing protein [Mucilaginibacter sp. KACC 22063]
MFKKPLSLKGRIRRTEYALSFFVYAGIALFATAAIFAHGSMLWLLAYPLLLWFGIAQNTKRCHDVGNSGWYQFIPFYVLVLLFAGSQPGTNQYGANPKGKEMPQPATVAI